MRSYLQKLGRRTVTSYDSSNDFQCRLAVVNGHFRGCKQSPKFVDTTQGNILTDKYYKKGIYMAAGKCSTTLLGKCMTGQASEEA